MKKLMRNTVGKLMRDTVTGKLQVYDLNPMGADCEFCDPGKTPKYITLTVTGLSDCIACYDAYEGFYKVRGMAAVLNSCVVVLEQTAEYNCIWEKVYTNGDFGTLTKYISLIDCAGESIEYAMDTLTFRVTKCAAGGLLVNINVAASLCLYNFIPVGAQVFAYEIHAPAPAWQCKTAEITDCVGVNNLANTVGCSEGGPWAISIIACSSGLVSITEGKGVHYAAPSVQYQQRLPASDVVVQWSRSAGVDNRVLVDDPYGIPDDDATYTYTNVQTNKDYFGLTPLAVPVGSVITNVEVHGRFRRMDAGGDYLIRELLEVNGITYVGANQQLAYGLPSVYEDKVATWTTNPDTGLAWTLDDVNGIGSNPLETFGYECIGFQKTVRATQVYVKVNYEYHW